MQQGARKLDKEAQIN